MMAAGTHFAEWLQIHGQEPASVSDKREPDQKEPPPLKPPREPRSHGSELSFLVGFGVLPMVRYAYHTRVALAGPDELQYSGGQSAPGLAHFVGSAFNLPGRIRRITEVGSHEEGRSVLRSL